MTRRSYNSTVEALLDLAASGRDFLELIPTRFFLGNQQNSPRAGGLHTFNNSYSSPHRDIVAVRDTTTMTGSPKPGDFIEQARRASKTAAPEGELEWLENP